MNTGAPWPTPLEAEARVLRMQTKLHQWATDDRARRFADLFNLVADPAFLRVAWRRVRGNRGARTAGIDGQTACSIEAGRGEAAFLADLRADLRARTFRPVPVRERMIPKSGGKRRRLGIPTVRDRVVQAALKLVLEPIFEADFAPCSYGFRPERRAQDAIAEIHFLASRSYEWVLDADISACFDEIDHRALMGRVRARIGDRRVLALVAAFLRAGILGEDGVERDTTTGTPQGGRRSRRTVASRGTGTAVGFRAAGPEAPAAPKPKPMPPWMWNPSPPTWWSRIPRTMRPAASRPKPNWRKLWWTLWNPRPGTPPTKPTANRP